METSFWARQSNFRGWNFVFLRQYLVQVVWLYFVAFLLYPSVFLSPDAPSLTRVSSARTVSPPRDVLHCTSLPTVASRAGAWPKVRGRAKIAFCCLDRLLLLRISVQHRILPLFFKKRKTHKTSILQEKQEGGSALLTPWSRILLEKLSGSQLVKKIRRSLCNPKIHYCIHKCRTPVPILSQINPVHVHHPTSWISILMWSSHLLLGLPSGLFPSGFPTKLCKHISPPSSYVLHAPPITFSVWSPKQYWVRNFTFMGPCIV